MAGIGFELRKLFNKDSIISSAFAGIYATVVTIGPTIMVIVAINLMNFLLPYARLSWIDKETLSTTILYVFIFSLIISSLINIILSRYTADKIYLEDYDSVLPAMDSGNLILAILVAVTGIPFGYAMYKVGGLSVDYVCVTYLFYVGLTFTFYYMTFITLLKEYRRITFSFLFSLAVGILFACCAVFYWNFPVTDAIVDALAISFNLIAMLLMSRLRRNFRNHNKNYREVFYYFWKYRSLLAANALYTIGIYSHNFIFWFFSQYQVKTRNVFLSAPVYDAVTYIAMLSNISILVIFVVNVETKFHTAYKAYCESIIGASGKDIIRAKNNMIEVLRRELLHIIQLQMIVNICVFVLVIVFASQLGINGRILTMYPILSIAYMVLYLVQCMMIFLFYLDDAIGAAVVSFVFLIGSTIGSLVSVNLPAVYAGGGVLFGSLIGFTVVFFRIRYKLVHLDEHIYCRGQIAEEDKKRKWYKQKEPEKVVIYSFHKNEA